MINSCPQWGTIQVDIVSCGFYSYCHSSSIWENSIFGAYFDIYSIFAESNIILFTCSFYNSWERHRDGNICNSSFHNPEPGGATLCHHVASRVKLDHHIWAGGQVHRLTWTNSPSLRTWSRSCMIMKVYVQGYLANPWQHDSRTGLENSINIFVFVCAILVVIGNISVKLLECWCAIAFRMIWGCFFQQKRIQKKKKSLATSLPEAWQGPCRQSLGG